MIPIHFWPRNSWRPALVIILISTLGWAGGILRNSVARAGDWPQILGPQRDGSAVDEQPLVANWQQQKPKVLWRINIGSGYAGATIVNGIAYLADREAAQERLTAVRLDSGQQVWQATWAAAYRSSMDPDSGPRSVPTITGNRAICYGAAGDLVCIELTNGQLLWQRPLRQIYEAEDGYFGAACSPLVIDQTIIVNVGGKKAGIVGVSLVDGKTQWTATDYDASYSSPIELKVDGRSAALVVTRLRTVLLDAQSGKVISEIDFGARGPTVNAATPIPVGENLFLLTASYNIGTKVISSEGGQLRQVFADRTWLASQYNTPVRLGKYVLGCDGREDMGPASARLLDVNTRALITEQALSGPTHMIAIGGQALMLSIDGTLQLAHLEGNKLQKDGSYSIAKDPSSSMIYRALPAFSNHVLVARGTRDGRGGEFVAVKLP
ncbi:MAG: PQQ-binding-like beta-propeller repeat protein [Pirellulaceae bacterium]|nr:PQQ-binding-like beta-propeller repeat protein [Pirellulaceae bacterium]